MKGDMGDKGAKGTMGSKGMKVRTYTQTVYLLYTNTQTSGRQWNCRRSRRIWSEGPNGTEGK